MGGSRAEEGDTDTDPLGRGGAGAHRRLWEWIGGEEVRWRGPFAVGRARAGPVVRAKQNPLNGYFVEVVCSGQDMGVYS